MQKFIGLVGNTYEKFASIGEARCGLLLAIRLYWGIQFAQDGWGKLTHLARVTGFLPRSTCPRPGLTAHAGRLIEFAGGILFAFGVASRLVSLVLFVNMTMAYLSVPDDRINFSHIFPIPAISTARPLYLLVRRTADPHPWPRLGRCRYVVKRWFRQDIQSLSRALSSFHSKFLSGVAWNADRLCAYVRSALAGRSARRWALPIAWSARPFRRCSRSPPLPCRRVAHHSPRRPS